VSPTQVWFKHDLRLDDHPGLAAALERHSRRGGGVIATFVFDPHYYVHLLTTPGGIEGEACHWLQKIEAVHECIRECSDHASERDRWSAQQKD